MDIQLFVGRTTPAPGQIEPISNGERLLPKPYGGIWTSTYHPDFGSDWIAWARSEFTAVLEGCQAHLLRLERSKKLRILWINSLPDLEAAHSQYPLDHHEIPSLDFEAIARDYDGMHLTVAGQARTRLTFPLSLYGWDCESTIWFRWCFAEVIPIDINRWIKEEAEG